MSNIDNNSDNREVTFIKDLQKRSEAIQLVAQAKGIALQGDYDKALELIDYAITLDPNSGYDEVKSSIEKRKAQSLSDTTNAYEYDFPVIEDVKAPDPIDIKIDEPEHSFDVNNKVEITNTVAPSISVKETVKEVKVVPKHEQKLEPKPIVKQEPKNISSHDLEEGIQNRKIKIQGIDEAIAKGDYEAALVQCQEYISKFGVDWSLNFKQLDSKYKERVASLCELLNKIFTQRLNEYMVLVKASNWQVCYDSVQFNNLYSFLKYLSQFDCIRKEFETMMTKTKQFEDLISQKTKSSGIQFLIFMVIIIIILASVFFG